MLSNLVISNQKFVLFVDNVGLERVGAKTIQGLLQEQGQGDAVKFLRISLSNPSIESAYKSFQNMCSNSETKVNVILPMLSDIQTYSRRNSELFQVIHQLKQNRSVKQVFLWASTSYLFETFTLACLEYMADTILYVESKTNLSILIRKPGGSVTNKHYTYATTKDSFKVEPLKIAAKKTEKQPVKPELLGTFKIELEEDELVARNSMKMPYEKTSESELTGGGNIIYTPDKDDDFDEEDPDDDLYI